MILTPNIGLKSVRGKKVQRNETPIDSDYQAVLDYATANSIPLPDLAQQEIDNQFMLDWKSSGAWEREDIFLKLTGTSDPAFKRICWKRLIQVDVFGSAVWDADGLQGNGSNVYIDPFYNPRSQGVNYQADDAGFTFLRQTEGIGAITGWYNGSNVSDYLLVRKNNSGEISFDVNSGFNSNDDLVYKIGLMGAYRKSGVEYMVGNGEQNVAQSPERTPYGNIMLMARNIDGIKSEYVEYKVGFISVGASKRDIHSNLEQIFN